MKYSIWGQGESSMASRFLRNGLLFAVILLLPSAALAQAGSGELTGEVRDSSGSLVANARVTITRMDTNQMYTSTTSEGGVYEFSNVKPGLYTLAVEVNGFKRFEHERVTVTTAERVRVDAVVQI